MYPHHVCIVQRIWHNATRHHDALFPCKATISPPMHTECAQGQPTTSVVAPTPNILAQMRGQLCDHVSKCPNRMTKAQPCQQVPQPHDEGATMSASALNARRRCHVCRPTPAKRSTAFIKDMRITRLTTPDQAYCMPPGKQPPHNGMLPCFFQGRWTFLRFSSLSSRMSRWRVSLGRMMSSRKP